MGTEDAARLGQGNGGYGSRSPAQLSTGHGTAQDPVPTPRLHTRVRPETTRGRVTSQAQAPSPGKGPGAPGASEEIEETLINTGKTKGAGRRTMAPCHPAVVGVGKPTLRPPTRSLPDERRSQETPFSPPLPGLDRVARGVLGTRGRALVEDPDASSNTLRWH